jgi:hypothetical protein
MKKPKDQQAQIDALTRQYLTDPKPEPNGRAPSLVSAVSKDDAEIIEKVRSERGGKFDRLFQGDISEYGNDDSSADHAFVYKLYSYTQDDEQIKRIHAASGLHRSKSESRADYLQRSIDDARKQVTWFYDWSHNGAGARLVTRHSENTSSDSQSQNVVNPFIRADLTQALRDGVEPPEALVPGILLKGKVHSIYSAGGTGKTFKMLYLVKRVVEQGLSVLIFDMENGIRIIAERLEVLGVTPEQSELIHYYPFPRMPLEEGVIKAFEGLLDEINPALSTPH